VDNFLVVGKSRVIITAVLEAIHSFSKAHIVVLGDEESAPLRWSRLCAKKMTIAFDGSTDRRFVEMANAYAAKYPHAMLLAVDCDAVRLTNRVRGQLKSNIDIAPIPDTHTLDMFDDKWQFHQFCVRHGLHVPMTLFAGGKDALDFDRLAGELGLPFVVKPTNMAGSAGVQIVTSKTGFEKNIAQNDSYRYGSLIVQRFIEGVDIDLSLLSVRGVLSALAIQQVNGSTINFVPNAYLETIASKIARDSAYHGVMHIDARIDKHTGQIFLIESNPRFWASLTAAAWCGFNFVAASVGPASLPFAPYKLTSGEASTKHPAVRPSAWKSLATDSGYQGRLLRAQVFDPYSLGQLAREVPVMSWRYAKRKAARDAKSPAH
jgi:predicted ATP-grasp superfamily ATP-dependent carboligase